MKISFILVYSSSIPHSYLKLKRDFIGKIENNNYGEIILDSIIVMEASDDSLWSV